MKKILSILAFVFPILVIGQTQTENYIKTTTYQVEEENENATLSNDQKIEGISYFDGLGRPMQNIGVRAGGNSEDIVTPIVYDNLGRQTKEYLPYATASQGGNIFANPVNTLNTFYNTPKYENTTNPYSESNLEPSPLSRILKQAAPGEDWKLGNGHEIEFEYDLNTATEVRHFKIGGTSQSPTLSQNSNWYYPANELYKTITRDENHTGTTKNHTTEEFKDKQGRVLLKRTFADIDLNNDGTISTGEQARSHDTYYVYDKFSNLTYVIPPKVTTSNVSTTELNELCYQYKYDSRNRLVEKKIPGKGWEFIIYNKLDQPVLTQDANLRGTGTSRKWLFTKYDAFGRVAYTGLYTYTDGNTDSWQRLSDLQDDVNNETIQFEGRSNSTVDGEVINWSNTAFPHTSITELHTVNYYDNYAFNTSNLGIPTGSIYGQTIATGNEIKGLATGSKVRVLGTNDWITTISVYDKKGQPIYIGNANSHLSTYDITQTEYDFTGKVLKIRNNHNRGGNPTIVTLDTFEYDHMGRLLNQIQCIGDGSLPDDCAGVGSVANLVLTSPVTTSKTEVASTSIVMDTGFIVDATVNSSLSFIASIESGGEQIVANHYDELGQLDYKNVGGKPSPSGGGATGGGGLQTVDYKYNIRGWLKEINNPNSLGTDLFAFKINYNEKDFSETSPYEPLYNGNISETQWITANDNVKRGYQYIYDDLNRLFVGRYGQGNSLTVENSFNVSVFYDKNGNISSLRRFGENNTFIDDLSYNYDNGNKLLKVTDAQNSTEGFKDGTNTGNDYEYDANGNMTKDFNKEIGNATTDGITYNHLNLPTTVTINGQNITYIYDAVGTKLKKTVQGVSTEYAGNYIYENGSLKFFSTAEGYYNVTSPPSGELEGAYVYQYKDHLGNIRLSYTDANGDGSITVSSDPNQTEIVKESNYYPFGLKHKGYNGGVSSLGNSVAKRFMFGGKESSEELDLNTYDFGARNYDAALGRWMNLDPLAEQMTRHSPYNYAFDNPIVFIDPDGMLPLFFWGTKNESGTGVIMHFGDGDGGRKQDDAPNKYEQYFKGKKEELGQILNGGEDCCGDVINGLGKSIGDFVIQSTVTFNPVLSGVSQVYTLSTNKELFPGFEVSEGELPSYIVGTVILAIFDPGPGGEVNLLKRGVFLTRSFIAKMGTQSFKSFSAFKRALGAAGKNRHWHHIVEQHADNVAKFGQSSIQNTKNVINIPGGFKGSLHGKITGHYNSLMPGTSMRVRDYVKTLPYDQQYQYGIDVLKRFGWTP